MGFSTFHFHNSVPPGVWGEGKTHLEVSPTIINEKMKALTVGSPKQGTKTFLAKF